MDKLPSIVPKKRIAVLGGGCAGLAAALQLVKKGYEVFVFEQASQIGGICGGVTINGNLYDYGPHLFHTVDKDIFYDIKNIAGNDIFPVERSILIKFLGEYFTYPLSLRNIFKKLPFPIIVKSFFSFLFYFFKGIIIKPNPETSETVLIRSYGRTLYELFFKSYITHVWGMPPSGFSPKFAEQRIPKLTTIDFIFKIISGLDALTKRKVSTSDYVEKVEGKLYTTKTGFLGIIVKIGREIEKNGGHVYINKKVIGLKRQGEKITHIITGPNSELFECDGVICTIPLSNMIKMITPSLPPEIVQSAEKLKYRSLVFVGLLIEKEKVLPASFVYFREFSFNRITDFSYFNFEIKPKGHTIIVAEISCGVNDRFWVDDDFCRESVINDLIRENLISRKILKEAHVFRLEHGYPIYELGVEDTLEKLFDSSASINNLMLAGREGRFQYVNAHIAMKMGYEAADMLDKNLKNKPERGAMHE